MKAVQMQEAVLLRLRNITQVNHGEFLQSSVIESFLNKAQDAIERKYTELLDKDTDARIHLGRLIKGTTYTIGSSMSPQATTHSNAYMFNMPTDMRLPILEEVTLTKVATNVVKKVRVKDVTGTHVELNTQNPFKKPYEDMVWRIEMGKTTNFGLRVYQLIYPSGYTFGTYYIDYVAYAPTITISTNTECYLELTVHNELVDLAVDLLIQTYQLQPKKN